MQSHQCLALIQSNEKQANNTKLMTGQIDSGRGYYRLLKAIDEVNSMFDKVHLHRNVPIKCFCLDPGCVGYLLIRCGTDQITRLFMRLVTSVPDCTQFLDLHLCVKESWEERSPELWDTNPEETEETCQTMCLCCFFKVSFGSRKQKNKLYADCTLPASVLLFVVLVTVLHLHLTPPADPCMLHTFSH